MAKPETSPKPPAETPGAPTIATSARYRVNWTLRGFKGKRYEAGDKLTATEAEAAPYLGKALNLIEKA